MNTSATVTMAAGKISRCNHIYSIGKISWEDIRKAQKREVCDECNVKASNLWLCLVGSCNYVGCGEAVKDHSSHHAETVGHCLTINLSTLRVWCYKCEMEIYHDRNHPPFLIPEKLTKVDDVDTQDEVTPDNSPQHSAFGGDDTESEGEDESGHQLKPRGLTGLQNLGNTCYLNAALQALSNCPPLTRYFLDCQAYVSRERNSVLSRNYLKLITEMWHKKRPSYLVPSGIVNGIKLVHPMFRGYSQQDTQEFLRCFMDQLHEELKQPLRGEDEEEKEDEPQIHDPVHEPHPSPVIGQRNPDRQGYMETSSTSSQSDDYETCDSAIGSEKDSAEQNCSSDDIDNSDVNELSRLTLSGGSREVRSHTCPVRRPSGRLDTNDDDNIPGKLKEKKETMNLSKRAADNVGAVADEQRSETGDYEGEESEPLRTKRQTTRRISASVDCTVKQSRGKPNAAVGPKKTTHCKSVISDIFDGKLSSSVQCLTCERISTTKETFQDLSLPIPSKDHVHMIHSSSHPTGQKGGACSEVHQGWIQWMFERMRSWFLGPVITLQDCLAAFFSADELKGDNMYSCEKCKKLRNGLKYSRVLQLPEILCIHLKRFRHEFYSSKISTYVSFPMTGLDMKSYLHKDHTSTVTVFDLVAVICHHGTAGGGHYTSYCQNVNTEQWYEFDDQYVTEVDVSQVVNCEAYVLFYRKQNDNMNNVRQEAVHLMSKREPSLMYFHVSKQWLNKFNTFAEPGPITNLDFLCTHGGVPPSQLEYIGNLVEPLPQSLWEFLHGRFGGGPACNHLFACVQCKEEQEKLRNRQKAEIGEFIKLNEKFKEEDNPSVIYAISMSWFKQWENFVREKDDDPPGHIDNKRISILKNNQYLVRPNSDYGQLSGDMWQFLFNIYGGGPELIIKQVPAPEPLVQSPPRTLVELSQTQPRSQTPTRSSSELTTCGAQSSTETLLDQDGCYVSSPSSSSGNKMETSEEDCENVPKIKPSSQEHTESD